MSTSPNFDWKNPAHLRAWNTERAKFWTEFRRKNGLPEDTGELLEQQVMGDFVPKTDGVAIMSKPGARQNQLACFHGEPEMPLHERLKFMDQDAGLNPQLAGASPRFYSTLTLMGRADGEIIIAPKARVQHPKKQKKAVRMFEAELQKKANRELACGLIGGVVPCRDCGARYAVSYECGNRYCLTCGPERANECFAKIKDRIQLAAANLMLCDNLDCKQCYWFRRGRTRREDGEQMPIPHWPPAQTGPRAKKVIAILDFMLPNVGRPETWVARRFNLAIKKTIRTLARRAGISRREYGYLFTDEYGAHNTNLHCHGIWVGPRLDWKEIQRAWRKYSKFIVPAYSKPGRVVIRSCNVLAPALYHAIKYPAKFGEHASGEWLAELEIAFHRVRRLHRLGAFYNMPKPEDEPEHDGRMTKCPGCKGPLGEPTFNRLLSDLYAEGLRNLRVVVREIAYAKATSGAVGLSP